MALLLCLPLVGCVGPLADLDHTREPAEVTSSLALTSTELSLSYPARGAIWKADPTASCEVSAAPEKSLHDDGTFRFVMAANQEAPIAFGIQTFLSRDGRTSSSIGLHADGVDWMPGEACRVELLGKDYDERSFSFRVNDCSFHHEGKADLVVAGDVRASRCFDPEAISVEAASDIVESGAQLAYDLGEAFVEDPVSFAKAIALLPLYAAGAH